MFAFMPISAHNPQRLITDAFTSSEEPFQRIEKYNPMYILFCREQLLQLYKLMTRLCVMHESGNVNGRELK